MTDDNWTVIPVSRFEKLSALVSMILTPRRYGYRTASTTNHHRPQVRHLLWKKKTNESLRCATPHRWFTSKQLPQAQSLTQRLFVSSQLAYFWTKFNKSGGITTKRVSTALGRNPASFKTGANLPPLYSQRSTFWRHRMLGPSMRRPAPSSD